MLEPVAMTLLHGSNDLRDAHSSDAWPWNCDEGLLSNSSINECLVWANVGTSTIIEKQVVVIPLN